MQANTFYQARWLKRLVGIAGAVLVLWGVSWLLVPPIVKSQIEARASDQLGRQVTLGKLEFKPWSLELAVHDLAVSRAKDSADPSPQLQIKRFYVDMELQSLVRLAPVVDAITLDEPHLRVSYLGSGRYDVDDILSRLSEPTDNTSKKSAEGPAKFALYNLALLGGTIDFSDKSTGKVHELRELEIKVPFLSNLESMRAVLVEPKLAFKLNGSKFESSAQATPFSETRKTEAMIKAADFDLAPYLIYAPQSLPVRLTSAVLNADVKVAFEQTPKVAVKVSGTLQVGKVRVLSTGDAADSFKGAFSGADLLDFDLLKMTISDLRPLERVARLAAVELNGPRVNMHRNGHGQLNLAALTAPKKSVERKESSAVSKVNGAAGRGWQLDVARLAVQAGELRWVDEGTRPSVSLSLHDLALSASDIGLPFVHPLQFDGTGNLRPLPSVAAGDAKAQAMARVRIAGSATDELVNATVSLLDVPLSLAAPYLNQFMTPSLTGVLNAELDLGWKARVDGAGSAELRLQGRRLRMESAVLERDKVRLASFKKLELQHVQVDLDRQHVALGSLSLSQPWISVSRDADGRWDAENWLKQPAAGSVPRPQSPPLPRQVPASPAKTWAVAVNDFRLDGGGLRFTDKSLAKQVNFDLSAVAVQLKNFSTDTSKPFAVNVFTEIRAGQSEPGHLAWRGSGGLSPLTAQGRVEAVRVPVHAFEPYIANALNIELLKAEASFKGQLNYTQRPEGPILSVSGDAAIEDFQANTRGSAAEPLQIAEELLNWKLLSLRGLELSLAPGTTTFGIKETALSDFFARIILSESGRLNLQDVMKPSAPAVPASPAGTPAISALTISSGPISLSGGRVHFSDRFIRPNYSANLTELTGKLSAFSSQSQPGVPNLAELELRGRAEGTASLEILGKVNPLTTPVVLDIKGKVRDLELPPLSPYSVRYAGYGIERGKLSVDVAYSVQPSGQLSASNNIVLNQLTFGDKVEGAPASLPVKLAVALLADRNGVIDINLPVSGSLNDPQFRVAPIVFKLIGNLIVKAITSPFSLLASAFGGGADELSVVNFAPGSAVLAPEARPALDKVAKALIDRPGLRMTVVGTASLDAERDAFKREQLRALVQAEKRRAALANPAASGAALPVPAERTVTDEEYPLFLKAVYRRADIPKPRNLLGMAKDLSVNEMESLLLAHLVASEESMRELAVSRGVVVRDYLAAQSLPLERLFLGAAKSVPPEAKWSPRAELNLSMP